MNTQYKQKQTRGYREQTNGYGRKAVEQRGGGRRRKLRSTNTQL